MDASSAAKERGRAGFRAQMRSELLIAAYEEGDLSSRHVPFEGVRP